MMDVSQGKERYRAWPRSRGKPKTKAEADRQKRFAAMQLASKFMSPQMMLDIMEAREGTPLLPRDIVTSMLSGRLCSFSLPTGKVLYPMAAKSDVSQALDTISQTPGKSIRRGADMWEAYDPSAPPGVTTLLDQTITTATDQIVSPDLTGFSSLLVIGRAVTVSGTYQRVLQVSTDWGSSYLTNPSDYSPQSAAGARSTNPAIFPHETPTTAARDFVALIVGLNLNTPAFAHEITRARAVTISGQAAPITHVRVCPALTTGKAGNLTGGRIIMLAV